MTFQAGNRVVAESESSERPARYGTVREVVHEDPHARYRIQWDDGRTSVYTPAAGAATARAGDRPAGGVTHDPVDPRTESRQRPGLADQRSRRRVALAPTLGFLLGAPQPAQRFSQGLGRASLYTAPTAPLFATGEKLLRAANKVQAIAQGTLVDRTR